MKTKKLIAPVALVGLSLGLAAVSQGRRPRREIRRPIASRGASRSRRST
jgi:hypothetical protein